MSLFWFGYGANNRSRKRLDEPDERPIRVEEERVYGNVSVFMPQDELLLRDAGQNHVGEDGGGY
jgi:hypothetical protein